MDQEVTQLTKDMLYAVIRVQISATSVMPSFLRLLFESEAESSFGFSLSILIHANCGD